MVLTSLKANFNIFHEFITQSLFEDLRFVSIYIGQNKQIGENDPSLMRHNYKRFFSPLKNYEIMWKKRTDIGTMPWIRKKIKIGLFYGAKLF